MYSFKLKIRGAQFYSEKMSKDKTSKEMRAKEYDEKAPKNMNWGDYKGIDIELNAKPYSFVGLGVYHTLTSAIMVMLGERPVNAKHLNSSSDRLLIYNMPLYNTLRSIVNNSAKTFDQESFGNLPKRSLRNYHGGHRNKITFSRGPSYTPPPIITKAYASLGIDLPLKEGLIFMTKKIKEAEANLSEFSSVGALRAKQKQAKKEFGKESKEFKAIDDEISLIYTNATLAAKEKAKADGNKSIKSKIYLLWGLKNTDPENPVLKYLEFFTKTCSMTEGTIAENTVYRDFQSKNPSLTKESRPDGFSLEWAHNTIEHVNVYSGEMSLLIEDKAEAKALFGMFKSGPGVASFGNGGIIESQLPKFFDEMEIK